LAAQLAYYFFLALFPAVLFVLALGSFFPLTNFIDDIVRTLRPIAPAEVLGFLEEQLKRLSNADSRLLLWFYLSGLAILVGAENERGDRTRVAV
jgi:membrane protein